MYSEYAEIGCFDVRLSTQSRFDNKIIKMKHVICNRGGKQKKKSCDTLDYKVFQFDELHNHPLEKRSDLKKMRQMSYSEKEFIVHASTSKIGPTMAHKLRASLRAFLKTHGKEPTLFLTDQDAAIKQAVENVFRNSKHRLCMWHIMKKLKKKISDDLFTNTDFRKRFSKLVWDNNMKPDVFEVKWGLLMKEFNLEDTRWFKDMFTIRDSWIPGYFSDIPMCGLMKTTSRSESMNSFFNTYSESGNLLLNFMMNYDIAIQKQRNTQRDLDRASKKASYKMQTPREIELQASKMVGKFTLYSPTTVNVILKMNLR
ncbi:unnamed protein product [Lactuca saligna]|uniref:MULE transposase domain-containing protein n=1 Tax=Lactuca saligna TaxID=75948 RepID=A0AA35UYD1_LACSI|nr:unnamed protein product [Lactuca saligna]